MARSSNSKEKYERQKLLARERQRRRHENMTEEEKEAKRKYDRERMARLRSEKKIKSIADMTPREQRKMKKYWRERNKVRAQKKKALAEALSNTPPQSPSSVQESAQRRRGRRKVRKEKAKVYRTVKKQKKEIKSLKKRLERYKKRLQREKQRSVDPSSPSPRKQLTDLLGKQRVSPAVKRQLFLGLALRKQIRTQQKMLAGSKKKIQILRRFLGNKVLKRYRIQRHFSDILPYKANKILRNQCSLEYSRKKKASVMQELSIQLQQFYEDDRVSRMCPGKRDFVKKGSVKKQRRVLLHPLQELHKMFKNESNCKILFTTFTRARPFWVSLPKKSDRETCLCIKHANMELLVSALKQAHVIRERNPNEVVKAVVCSVDKEDCMKERCDVCKDSKIMFFYENDFKVKYFKWKIVSETKVIKNKKRVVKRTKKVKMLRRVSKLEDEFVKELAVFKKHVSNAKHQIDVINTKINNLKTNELVFRIDFSENYVTKLAKEIQSYHFGASKRQLCLNTGVRYANINKHVESFCFATVSENIDHQAHAIWAHMEPIFKKSADEFPETTAIHMVSDSPSSQYRNRYNMHLFEKILPRFFPKVKSMTWSFTEAGHGKGPMDGVGGTLKRLADRKVAYGVDITNAKDFVEALKECQIFLIEVPSEQVKAHKERLLRLKINPIKGIMKVRQFAYSNGSIRDARELSCFACSPSQTCRHYSLKKTSKPGTSSVSSKTSPVKKVKLSVETIYTSSEDEDQHCADQPLPLRHFVDSVNQDKDFSSETLQSGDYVLVEYIDQRNKKNIKHYVGICQSNMVNREIEIMFMKSCTKDNNLYYVDENDKATVLQCQILKKLPQPKINLKGNRVFYKFMK